MDKNTLLFALACDSVIRDDITGKPIFVGVFDLLVIPKGQEKLVYTFMVGGKIFLKTHVSSMEVKILDPDNSILKKVYLNGGTMEGDTDLRSYFPLTEFTKQGVYKIKISVDNVDCEDGDKFYFEVRKL